MRERDIIEISSYLGEMAEKAINSLEDDSIPRKRINKLLDLIDKLDKEELKEEQEALDLEEFENGFLKVHEDVGEAKKALKEGNKELLIEYLSDIKKIEEIVLKNILAYDLTDLKEEKGERLGQGAEGEVYELPEGKVLKEWDPRTTSVKDLKRFYQQQKDIPDKVNFARTLKVGFFKINRGPYLNEDYDSKILPVSIMEKAPGKPVHYFGDKSKQRWAERIDLLAEAPQRHYDKLREDEIILRKHGIFADKINPENLFYHPKKGFTFIDVSHDHSMKKGNSGSSSNYSTIFKILTSLKHGSDFANHFSQIAEIRNKLLKAGYSKNKEFESSFRELSQRYG